MADSNESFNFGIVDTSAVMGNLKAVDAFLSDSAIADDESLEEVGEEEEKKPAQSKTSTAKKAPVESGHAKSPVKKEAEKEAEVTKTTEEILFAEEEEEEEDKNQEEESKDGDEKKSEESDFESLSKDLINLGVFTQDSENDVIPKTAEEFLAKFNLEKQKGATQWIDGLIGRFGDDRKELFEAIFINGVDPQEYLPVYSAVQNLESLDLTDETNQEKVYREFYRRLKFSPEAIDKKLQKAKDYGDLEEESKSYHQQIVEQDKEVLAEQSETKAAKLAAEQKADAEYKTAISKILNEKLKTKEFNGIPISQDLATKVFDRLYTKRYKTTDGQLLTEFDKFILETKRPENLEKRITLALLDLINFDFSKITKRAVSKESNELFNTFAQRKAKKAEGTASNKSTAARDWLQLG